MSPRVPQKPRSNRAPDTKRSLSVPPIDTGGEGDTVEVNGETLVVQQTEDWE